MFSSNAEGNSHGSALTWPSLCCNDLFCRHPRLIVSSRNGTSLTRIHWMKSFLTAKVLYKTKVMWCIKEVIAHNALHLLDFIKSPFFYWNLKVRHRFLAVLIFEKRVNHTFHRHSPQRLLETNSTGVCSFAHCCVKLIHQTLGTSNRIVN